MLKWFARKHKPQPLPPIQPRAEAKEALAKVVDSSKRQADSFERARKQLEFMIAQYGLDDHMKGADPHRHNERNVNRS